MKNFYVYLIESSDMGTGINPRMFKNNDLQYIWDDWEDDSQFEEDLVRCEPLVKKVVWFKKGYRLQFKTESDMLLFKLKYSEDVL